MSTTFWIVIGAIVIVLFWIVATFNGLVLRRRRVDEAWSDIDVQLKRRHDLIPNLVQAVQGYTTHEAGVFQKVTEARAVAMGAKTPGELAAAENMLTGALKTLFAVAESYPDLKASQNFLRLQDELADAENKIQAARRFYNGNVRDYNTAIEQFPTNVIAGAFHFNAREFFELAEPSEREAPQVKF